MAGRLAVDDHRPDGRPRPDRAVPEDPARRRASRSSSSPGSRAGSCRRRADLVLHRGEVLGIAGLVGAGRTELLRAIFGLDPVKTGRGPGQGRCCDTRSSPRRRIAQGVGFLSEDRKAEGLALGRSIEDNLTYSGPGRHARWGWLDLKGRRAEAEALDGAPAGQGGRARAGRSGRSRAGTSRRWRSPGCSTRTPTSCCSTSRPEGSTSAPKAEIYRLIGEQAASGKAVLMVSSYLPELMGICDRIAVMSRGVLSEATAGRGTGPSTRSWTWRRARGLEACPVEEIS